LQVPSPQWLHDWDSDGLPLVVSHELRSLHVRACWFEHEQADQPPQDQLGWQPPQLSVGQLDVVSPQSQTPFPQ